MANHMIYTEKFSTDIEKFQSLAENDSLSKNDLRLFMFLCCRLNSKRYLRIDKSQISDSLSLPKKKIDDSLEKLISEGIIEKGSDDHAKTGYRFIYTEIE